MKANKVVDIDWSIEGLKYALRQGHIAVIVDTLRFSTATITAVNYGFTIYPVSCRKKGIMLAKKLGAHVAGRPGTSRYSISPRCYVNNRHDQNKKVVLFSPNGATCSEVVKKGQLALIGGLLNARAIARFLNQKSRELGKNVTIIAAGEQRAFDSGNRITYDIKSGYRVFAIEDYIGAGAIIEECGLSKTIEAKLCVQTFLSVQNRLKFFLKGSFSGRYLLRHRLKKDIDHAVKLNRYNVVPVINSGRIERLKQD